MLVIPAAADRPEVLIGNPVINKIKDFWIPAPCLLPDGTSFTNSRCLKHGYDNNIFYL